MEEPHARILEYLEAQGALSSWLIVAAATYPPASYKPADGPCAAFQVRGGTFADEDDHQFPSVQFKVYGTSAVNAAANYKTLHDALQNASGAYVRKARAETAGQPLIEPATGWHYVLAYYRLMVRNAA